ncbi:HEPN domain-containing protein [Thermofilum pendens]|uniref:HEPN domain-containing protein n=1 Tax=Thermofilum pendens TaxID=2269 RepID=UPI00315DB6A4
MACFYAEQSTQLRLKAFILRHMGFMPRIHDIRELLAIIYKYTRDSRVDELMRRFRRELRDLVEGYVVARYGSIDYSRDDAEVCIGLMRDLWRLIESVEGGCVR